MKEPLDTEGASRGALLVVAVVIVLLLATTIFVFGEAFYVPAMPQAVMLLPFLAGGVLLGLSRHFFGHRRT